MKREDTYVSVCINGCRSTDLQMEQSEKIRLVCNCAYMTVGPGTPQCVGFVHMDCNSEKASTCYAVMHIAQDEVQGARIVG